MLNRTCTVWAKCQPADHTCSERWTEHVQCGPNVSRVCSLCPTNQMILDVDARLAIRTSYKTLNLITDSYCEVLQVRSSTTCLANSIFTIIRQSTPRPGRFGLSQLFDCNSFHFIQAWYMYSPSHIPGLIQVTKVLLKRETTLIYKGCFSLRPIHGCRQAERGGPPTWMLRVVPW